MTSTLDDATNNPNECHDVAQDNDHGADSLT
jgi:hypothetical protein